MFANNITCLHYIIQFTQLAFQQHNVYIMLFISLLNIISLFHVCILPPCSLINMKMYTHACTRTTKVYAERYRPLFGLVTSITYYLQAIYNNNTVFTYKIYTNLSILTFDLIVFNTIFFIIY